MNASSIIMMIKEEKLVSAEELAVFLDKETDLFILLQQLELLLEGCGRSPHIEVVMNYAAVHQPDALKRYLYSCKHISVMNMLESVSTDTVVGQHVHAVYDVHKDSSFLEKARACVRKHGIIGCNDMHDVMSQMRDAFEPLGYYQTFYQGWNASHDMTTFPTLWHNIINTKLFIMRPIDHHSWSSTKVETAAFEFRVAVTGKDLAHVYPKANADLRSKLERVQVVVRVRGFKKGNKIPIQVEPYVDYLAGTRQTTKDAVEKSGYKDKLFAEAEIFMFKGLVRPTFLNADIVVGKNINGELMKFIMTEGAEQLRVEGVPDGSVSVKTA